MQHYTMMIFYPGGVSYGVPEDISDDKEVYDIMYNAATIEEGNGNGKVKQRKRECVPEESTRRAADNRTKRAKSVDGKARGKARNRG